jgi:transketolase
VDTITTIEPIADKWRAFGWDAVDLNGHDAGVVAAALATAAGRAEPADTEDAVSGAGRPQVLICRTSTRHGLACLPPDADGHFIKLPADLAAAAIAELTEELARHDA